MPRIRARVVTSLSAAALAGFGTVAIATDANAADVTVDCSTPGTTSVTAVSVTVTFTRCAAFYWNWTSAGTGSMSFVFNPGSITTGIPAAGDPPQDPAVFAYGATSFTATMTGSNRSARFVLDNSGTDQIVELILPATVDPPSAPADLVQQFGKPSTGSCDAAQPDGLNWGGVPSGGWANSWSQWMNGGNGGFVCTRTLVCSTTESKWILG